MFGCSPRAGLRFVVLVGLTLPAARSGRAAEAEVECYLGKPFGIGRLFVPVEEAPTGLAGLELQEADGRVLYPVVDHHRHGLLRSRRRPEGATIYFLFRGDEPLRLTVPLAAPVQIEATPVEARRREDQRLADAWWVEYITAAEESVAADDHPPLVEHYLTTMLARRLGRPPVELEPTRRRERLAEDKPAESAEMLAGAERLRTAIAREMLLADGPAAVADQPVPPPIDWEPLPPLPAAEDVDIESLAKLVPPECCYLRFGKLSNFLWVSHLSREQGGDLGRLVLSRGQSRDLRERFERQFAIRYSLLADLFGDQVVADLALFGTDLFLADGASLAVLVEARSTLLLDAAIGRERSASAERESVRGGRRETIEIAGREVDLLTSPDNGLRSFLASHGKYRLISNSRTLVERFFAVVDGGPSLGETREFRHARTHLPTSRNDTIFAYFPASFFQGLLSPHYQVELRRRLRAANAFQLVELAERAALREGLPTSPQSLVEAGLLPANVLSRPEGGGLARAGDTSGEAWIDTLRGGRGTFLPIADMPVRGLTAAEAEEWRQLAEYYGATWRRADPLAAAIRREVPDEGPERIEVELRMSPFERDKYGAVLSALGDANTLRFTAPPDALLTAQASLRGGALAPGVPAHNLFGAVLNQRPTIDRLELEGLIAKYRFAKAIPGYLGAWPRPGFLDFWPLSRRREDDEGFTKILLGLWRQRIDDTSFLSFHRELLEGATPHIRIEEGESPPAQVRFRLLDLTGTNLAPWLDEVTEVRAGEASVGNVRLLELLRSQLGVPDAELVDAAERLFDAKLVCPLGGTYVENGSGRWRSTATAGADADAAADSTAPFTAPLLRWFRGGSGWLAVADGELTAHLELRMQR